MELPAGATIGQLIEQLGLPEREIKVVFVNGVAQELDYVLADGDRVGIFPRWRRIEHGCSVKAKFPHGGQSQISPFQGGQG